MFNSVFRRVIWACIFHMLTFQTVVWQNPCTVLTSTLYVSFIVESVNICQLSSYSGELIYYSAVWVWPWTLTSGSDIQWCVLLLRIIACILQSIHRCCCCCCFCCCCWWWWWWWSLVCTFQILSGSEFVPCTEYNVKETSFQNGGYIWPPKAISDLIWGSATVLNPFSSSLPSIFIYCSCITSYD